MSTDINRTLAQNVFERFGKNLDQATRAWQRLMQNNCTSHQFSKLLESEDAPTFEQTIEVKRSKTMDAICKEESRYRVNLSSWKALMRESTTPDEALDTLLERGECVNTTRNIEVYYINKELQTKIKVV